MFLVLRRRTAPLFTSAELRRWRGGLAAVQSQAAVGPFLFV